VRVEAIIAAGGKGQRFGKVKPKQFCLLRGQPVICWTLDIFQRCPLIHRIILVIPQGMIELSKKVILPERYTKVKAVVEGGQRRMDSVSQGLKHLTGDADVVLIHDGVRPLLPASLLNRVIRISEEYEAITPGIPLKETVKKAGPEGYVLNTLKREKIYLIQTPQAFQSDLIKKAHQEAQKMKWDAPDDAYLVEKLGKKVRIIKGSELNIKITTSLDLRMAEVLLGENIFVKDTSNYGEVSR